MPDQGLEPSAFKRGPGGRPTRQAAERRHRDLLSAAASLFLKGGWDGTSIDEISRVSGVAKRFIYARYPDKAALFVGALEGFVTEQVGVLTEQVGTLLARDPLPDDIEEGLVALGHRLLDLALKPEALAFHRLFIAEAPRFPGLARLFIERNRSRGTNEILRVLAPYAQRGLIALGNPQMRAEQFFILTAGIPQRLALLIGRETMEEEEHRLRDSVRLFLDGCRISAK